MKDSADLAAPGESVVRDLIQTDMAPRQAPSVERTDAETLVSIGARLLKLTRLKKLLYPAAGLTNAEIIDYYVRAAPVLLPHLAERPVALKRYPGVYSPRAKSERPYASMPVRWEESERAFKRKAPDSLLFCPQAALERIAELGDLLQPVLTVRQRVPAQALESIGGGLQPPH